MNDTVQEVAILYPPLLLACVGYEQLRHKGMKPCYRMRLPYKNEAMLQEWATLQEEVMIWEWGYDMRMTLYSMRMRLWHENEAMIWEWGHDMRMRLWYENEAMIWEWGYDKRMRLCYVDEFHYIHLEAINLLANRFLYLEQLFLLLSETQQHVTE